VVPSAELRGASVDYWRTDFDWEAEERRLNHYPQFIAVIDDEPIHFVWMRAQRAEAPRSAIVMTHGWPGSFIECASIAATMTSDDRPTNRSITPDSLSDKPSSASVATSIRTAIDSLSTSTPSQSKSTRSADAA
jgi:hypothetical protein